MSYRILNLLLLALIAVTAIFLFVIKEKVSLLNHQLMSLTKQIVEEQDKIHLLKAEYTSLNNPSRLNKIVKQNLALVHVAPSQLIKNPLYDNSQELVSETKGLEIAQNLKSASDSKDTFHKIAYKNHPKSNMKSNVKWRYKKMNVNYISRVKYSQ